MDRPTDRQRRRDRERCVLGATSHHQHRRCKASYQVSGQGRPPPPTKPPRATTPDGGKGNYHHYHIQGKASCLSFGFLGNLRRERDKIHPPTEKVA